MAGQRAWRLVAIWAAVELMFVLWFQWAGYAGELIIVLFTGLTLLFGGYYAAWQAHTAAKWDQWRLLTPRWLSLLCAHRSTQLPAPLAVAQVSMLGGGGGLVWALATGHDAWTYTVTGLAAGAISVAALWSLWFLWRYVA